ncbi:hypothetical protein P3828_23110, partial [Pseudomonas aeruginosa]|nr:hypothetical protein [Pseudomonas aeruginosa]
MHLWQAFVVGGAARFAVLHEAADEDVEHRRQQQADSVEKVGLAAACRSGVPAVEVTASHFRLP